MIVDSLKGLEILDSRGRPTVRVRCTLRGGETGHAAAPSGASRGSAEAHELRDGDPRRHAGLGCLKAVQFIDGEISANVVGREFSDQESFDAFLVELDGTPNKSRLGGNTILALSLAFARASAHAASLPLYRYLAGLRRADDLAIPTPVINLFSGGAHTSDGVEIQDVMIIPRGESTVRHLEIATDVYRSATRLMVQKYGTNPRYADEGGIAPPADTSEMLLSDAVEAIASAGLRPGVDVGLGIDVAATQFLEDDGYRINGSHLDSRQMVDLLEDWRSRYPLDLIEDGLGEEDWDAWRGLTLSLGENTVIVGDDLLTTNPTRITKASRIGACNGLLLKVNQIGTVTEALESLLMARNSQWDVVVSARSGETEDDWLGDVASGFGANMIKVGSVRQSDRLAKYNRLLEIEAETSHG